MPDSLPAALFRHAAERPEEPWLFHRRGWDWHWLPFRAVAERVALWTQALSGLPPGTRAAFAAWPGPHAIALDLAVQAAGLCSVPLPEEPRAEALAAVLAERQAQLWIGPGGREIPPWIEEEPSGLSYSAPTPPPPLASPAGGALLDGGTELTAADLVAAAEAIEALLPAGRSGREILVSCHPLSDPAERRLLAWATWTGAALLLEADRAAGPATALWARPTLFHGDANDLAALRRAVSRRRLFRPRLPFGRLHTIFPEGELPAEERSFWEERGVQAIQGF